MSIGTRITRAIGMAAVIAIVLPATAIAAPPEHSPAVLIDLPLGPGDACDFAVDITNPDYRMRDTAFAPHKNGSQRFTERGFNVIRGTNPDNGKMLELRGGAAFTFAFAADGALEVDGRGLFFAWYLPGDDSDLGPGLWLVRGHGQEVYDADGNFVRATFSGMAIDACAALGD